MLMTTMQVSRPCSYAVRVSSAAMLLADSVAAAYVDAAAATASAPAACCLLHGDSCCGCLAIDTVPLPPDYTPSQSRVSHIVMMGMVRAAAAAAAATLHDCVYIKTDAFLLGGTVV
jgi:hypothetical protein